MLLSLRSNPQTKQTCNALPRYTDHLIHVFKSTAYVLYMAVLL